jgi:hypothetical protein
MKGARATLWPLFFVSAGVLGYEIALTRYFAVAKWSEYGYWVISIVMVGFALSGVVVALLRDLIARHGAWLQTVLPAAMVAAAAAGWHAVIVNPFNPLQLQNAATWLPQVANIGLYYAWLLPFFFLAGLYVSLSFVLNDREIGRVYGYDLVGAGAGAAAALGLMFLAPPFALTPIMLALLAAAALFQRGAARWVGGVTALAVLAAGEFLLLKGPQPAFNDFKAIYAPLHTPDARVLSEIRSPRGQYLLLEDFTERVDTDLSNNAALMGVAGPPQTWGLYRDGNRISAVPKPGGLSAPYARAGLAAAPYLMRPGARVLLIGASGGFRAAEALELKAGRIDVLEPEPVLHRALSEGLAGSQRLPADPRVQLLSGGPIAAVRAAGPGRWDLIDLAPDFLDAGEANQTAFTAEALADYLRALSPGGAVSIPVSIKDFPVYATRMLATTREGLKLAGVADPTRHVIVYRSAWSVRILVSAAPWGAREIEAVRAFADERSFDVSYYPGIDVTAARAGIYNDLPPVSFRDGTVQTAGGPADAIADEAEAVLAGRASRSGEAFDLSPVTLDKPFYYDVLRLSELDTVVRRLEILPQAEIGALVNLAVLAQAILIALLVLAVPLLAPNRVRAEPGSGLVRPVLYFPALGLGFLFIEIFLIEKAAFYLNDRTTAFALVLTGMLVFSGLGSLLAGLLVRTPRVAVSLAGVLILAWLAAAWRWGDTALFATLQQPFAVRVGLIALALAPVSVALGLPFPLGLTRVGSRGFLPWAWGLNGAFSVVATPLANLVAREAGFSTLLVAAGALYALVVLALPAGAPARRAAPAPHPIPPEPLAEPVSDPVLPLPEEAPA